MMTRSGSVATNFRKTALAGTKVVRKQLSAKNAVIIPHRRRALSSSYFLLNQFAKQEFIENYVGNPMDINKPLIKTSSPQINKFYCTKNNLCKQIAVFILQENDVSTIKSKHKFFPFSSVSLESPPNCHLHLYRPKRFDGVTRVLWGFKLNVY